MIPPQALDEGGLRTTVDVDDRGLTLVELTVGLVVAGILTAGMFRLLLDQNRFYGEMADRSYAEETLRASAALAATELRMVTSGDVIAARSDSLMVRSDILRAFVCDVESTDNVYLYVSDETLDPALAGARGTAYADPFQKGYEYDPNYDASGTATAGAQSVCEDRGAPAGKAAERYRLEDWAGALDPPEPGAVVRVYRRLSYYFAPSQIGDGLALWRNDEELAAPFASGAGFQYYVCTPGGGCSWMAKVTDASDQRHIRRIRIDGQAIGDGANRHGVAVDLDYDIPVRNFIP